MDDFKSIFAKKNTPKKTTFADSLNSYSLTNLCLIPLNDDM